ncbi:MAG: ArsR family transcriptional regulator [Candidatus Heimdallarchaeota archaeon]|nr:ArsR family transcriptional regulator [Candidatus Heimdallarchaeota archaeon]
MGSEKDMKLDKNSLIKDEIIVSNPSAVPVIFHEKKSQILKCLINKEMTIIDLKHKTGLNPGTIKRHIDDLLEVKLIYISREQLSEYGMVMKYYRAVSKSYKFLIEWP